MSRELASLPGALAGTRVLVAHPSGELYGSDRMLLETVSALVEARAEVTLALASDGPLAAHARRRGAGVVVCESPVLRKSMLSVRGMVRLVAGTVRGLRDGRRLLRRVRPDVVLVNTLTIPLWMALPHVTSTPGRRPRVICHVHEAEGKASPVVGRLLVAPLTFADSILANSRYSIEVLRRFSPRVAGRAVLIDNGVVGPRSPHRARIVVDGPVRLLYVGRLSERKGVDVAVDAVRVLRDRAERLHPRVVAPLLRAEVNGEGDGGGQGDEDDQDAQHGRPRAYATARRRAARPRRRRSSGRRRAPPRGSCCSRRGRRRG